MRIFFTLLFFFFSGFISYAQTDAKVEAVYTLAQIPAPLGVYKHVVQARIINKGTAVLSNLPVTLTVSGANTYSNIQFTDIAPGDTSFINFNSFSPWNNGNNLVSVTVPADDNNANNSSVYTQTVNADTYSYADDSAPVSSIGYGNGDGMLLTRYNVSGSAVVKKVKVFISNDAANVGNTVYGVVVNFGTILGQSEPYIISNADLNTYMTFDIVDPPNVDYDFYAGLIQTANTTTAYYPVAFQQEGIPTRPDAYYGSMSNGSGLTAFNYFGRLMIQAVVEVGTVTPFNASASTPNIVLAGWDFSGANAPTSFAATTFDTSLSSSNLLTRSAAAVAGPGIHSFRSTGFQNTGIALTNTAYFQVTLAPKPGDTLSLNVLNGYVHGNSTDISSSPVRSQFAYSTDGINFTLISSAFISTDNVKNFNVSVASIPALQNIVNGTTITLRYYASGASISNGWGFVSLSPGMNGLAVYGRLVSSNSILTSPVIPTGAPFTLTDCSTTSTGSISFTSTGNFAPGNKYLVQLGQIYQPHFNVFRFKFPVTIGSLESSANSGVVNFTIPAGTSEFDPYSIRVISTNPYLEGSFSQPFVINTTYCHSQPTDIFRSKTSGNWNDINSWETSDGSSWIPATLTPTENATEITIEKNHLITISTNVLVTNTVVKGSLRLLNGNGNKGMMSFVVSTNPNPFTLAMKVDTSGVLQVVSSESAFNDVIFYNGGSVRIYGKVSIGDGTAAIASGYDGFATDLSNNISWLAGSVFEWNSVNGVGPSANNYFKESSEASTFRLTNIPATPLGNNEEMIVNGLLEVNTPVSFTGSGSKTFRDGIKGTSTITQAAGAGQFIVTSAFEEIPETPTTLASLKGILAGKINILLSANGLMLITGARLPDSAKVVLSGTCFSSGLLELTAGALLTLNPGSNIRLQDANLKNAGLINGTGLIQFGGNAVSYLSSTGMMIAPVVVSHKQLALQSNSNISALALTNESNIKLDLYNLNMIGTAELIADSVNFIVTNDTGRLNRYVVDDPVLYPVGISNNSYTPLTVSNTGNEDYLKVRVAQAVQTSVPLTSGNVNRTWFIGDSLQTGMNLSLNLRWQATDEQPGFDRNSCYISHYTSCPPPLNCPTSYCDASPGGAASGSSSYSIQRNGITNFRTPSFFVSSRPFVFTFTGNGDWNDAANWTPANVAPPVIPTGIEVIIDPLITGECLYNGDIILQAGGKLTVKPGKKLRITGNFTAE